MRTQRIRDWLEVIGIFGLIVSLIFVGFEMRQSQRIALSSIYQSRADSSMRIRMAPLESEALLSGVAKRRVDETLTAEEEEAIWSRTAGNLIYLENMHYQYLQGFISEEHWQTNIAEIRGLMTQSQRLRERALEANCSNSVWRESFCVQLKNAAESIAGTM